MKRMNRVFYELMDRTNARESLHYDDLIYLHEDLMDYADLHPDCKRDKYQKNRVLNMARQVMTEINRREAS